MQKKSERNTIKNDNRMVLGLILMCLLLAMGILVSVVVMGQKQKEIDRLNEEIIQLQQQIDGQKGFAFY